MTFATRFAPSPTGPLHLGHAYSALLAYDLTRKNNGNFLLRIEDIDQSRARPEWEEQICQDLKWLGIRWQPPVIRQSDQQAHYEEALDLLWAHGLLYPCTCTRRDIQNALSAPQEGVSQFGPDGLIYPGTCRPTMVHGPSSTQPHTRPSDVTLRLDMAAACKTGIFGRPIADQTSPLDGAVLDFNETGSGPGGETGCIEFGSGKMKEQVGDIVIARRDMGTSYHLSVVIDDARQGITDVVRGQDLFDATKIHVVLQKLLGLPTPVYHHHHLIRDDNGKRLAKRDDARAIAKYRADGLTPQDVRGLVGL